MQMHNMLQSFAAQAGKAAQGGAQQAAPPAPTPAANTGMNDQVAAFMAMLQGHAKPQHAKPCIDFANGFCRYGTNCKWQH